MLPETIYYQDENLIIRSMIHSDIEDLLKAFSAQNWHKPIEVLERYYKESQAHKRHIFIAEWKHSLAGYTTLMPSAHAGPFASLGIPYVSDFNVFIPYQRRGIGTKIMDCAERTAFKTHDSICLGVGLHPGYGTAQRMYAKRGYIPDGSGVWYRNERLAEGAPCFNDDDLVLYLLKKK
ncbi:MAG: GNAT family N-acetyltransferase [Clostridia bacterium]|nr:GNAT family N-acetyltransferase [Clostridia bacterium]